MERIDRPCVASMDCSQQIPKYYIADVNMPHVGICFIIVTDVMVILSRLMHKQNTVKTLYFTKYLKLVCKMNETV